MWNKSSAAIPSATMNGGFDHEFPYVYEMNESDTSLSLGDSWTIVDSRRQSIASSSISAFPGSFPGSSLDASSLESFPATPSSNEETWQNISLTPSTLIQSPTPYLCQGPPFTSQWSYSPDEEDYGVHQFMGNVENPTVSGSLGKYMPTNGSSHLDIINPADSGFIDLGDLPFETFQSCVQVNNPVNNIPLELSGGLEQFQQRTKGRKKCRKVQSRAGASKRSLKSSSTVCRDKQIKTSLANAVDRNFSCQEIGMRKFYCEWPGCDCKFARDEHLKRHKKTHEPKRYYVCPLGEVFGAAICSRCIFERGDNLTQHFVTHCYGNSTHSSRNTIIHVKVMAALLRRGTTFEEGNPPTPHEREVRVASMTAQLEKKMAAHSLTQKSLKVNAHIDHELMKQLLPDKSWTCCEKDDSENWYDQVDSQIPLCNIWARNIPRDMECAESSPSPSPYITLSPSNSHSRARRVPNSENIKHETSPLPME